MKQYHELLQEIIDTGVVKEDRTGTGTISVFGTQKRYDLREGFPLVTTKNTAFRLIVLELLWFLRGETNMRTLLQDNVNIWNDDAYKYYCKQTEVAGYAPVNKELFLSMILEDEEFGERWGDLGPVYGAQWRTWNGPHGIVDQINDVVRSIQDNPDSRRHLVTAWNPGELEDMTLPPCHVLMQFYVCGSTLSLQLYQRSADVFLGVPFNIASYALLLKLMAKHTGLEAAEFIHTTGDTHLYLNHIEQAKLQLSREPRELPTVNIIADRENIWDYQLEDFELVGYNPHPRIKAEQSS